MAKRKCIYKDDFQREWSFIKRGRNDNEAECKMCLCFINIVHRGRSDIKDHINTKKHVSNSITSPPHVKPERFHAKEMSTESNKTMETMLQQIAASEAINGKPSSNCDSFRFSCHPTLEELRQIQADFSRERHWDHFHQPRNLILALMGEVGELAEIFQWKGEVDAGLPGWKESEKEHLGEELSDILCYLIRLAEKCQIDLPAVAKKKIEKNRIKYPLKLVRGAIRKCSQTEDPKPTND